MAWTSTPGDVLTLLAEHSARWESFTFALAKPLTMAAKALLFDNELPLLKSLAVEGRGSTFGAVQPGEQRVFAFSEAPLLRTVHLNCISSSELALPWHQVRTLTLRGLGLSDTVEILRQTPHLETLSHTVSHMGHAPVVDFRLEFLTKLAVVENNHTSFLQQVTLPALQSLDVVFPVGSRSFSALPEFLERSKCALRTLALTNIWVEQVLAIIKIKHSTPTIVELTLTELRHDSTSGSGSGSGLLELASDGRIVPQLRKMRIECGSWEYIVPYLHLARIVEARAYRPGKEEDRGGSLRDFCFILGTRGFQVAPEQEDLPGGMTEHGRKLELERDADDAEKVLQNMEPHACRVVIEAPHRRLVFNSLEAWTSGSLRRIRSA
ncbi:hypothetical protein C8F01DRAFT_1166748 [Mycena amicta]|nr:hypothetical protein C8F01DRAFT_1166748 [Mycena amicta]